MLLICLLRVYMHDFDTDLPFRLGLDLYGCIRSNPG